MPLQVRLNFARIEGREIFVDLFENHLTRLLAQTLAQHPEKLRLRGKSQSLIPLMKPSLFDAVGDGLREFFAILLAQRRSTRDDIDEVFDFPQIQFESRCLEESCTAAVGNDNPGSDSHGAPLSVIGRRPDAHRKSLRDAREPAGQQ
jgi:hypothetical protein